MAEVGSAFVSILPSAKGFGSKLDSEVGGPLRSSGKRLGSGFGKAFALAGGAVAALGVAAWAKGTIGSLTRIERINAQTAQAIKSTGGAAGVSAKHIENLAGRLENLTASEAETTQEGANLLLTFTNVRNGVGKGNKIFDQATGMLVDMSRALGTDAKGSAIQLGKALNDPVKGITALQRVGVSFTEGQKTQIKSLVESGNTMKAQKVILGELTKEFGGSGKAYAKTTQGQIDLAKHAFGTLSETILGGVLPPLGKLAGVSAKGLNSLATKVQPATAAVKGMVSAGLDRLAPQFDTIKKALAGDEFQRFKDSVVTIGQSIASNVLPVLSSMSQTFTTVVLPAISKFGAYLAATLLPIFQQVGTIIATQVVPIVASLAQFFYGTLYPAIVKIVTQVAGSLKPVFDQLALTFQTQILPAVSRLLDKFREWQPTIQKVLVIVLTLVGWLLRLAAAILGKVLPPLIKFAGWLIGKLFGAIGIVIGIIVGLVKGLIAVGKGFVAAYKFAENFGTKVNNAIKKVLDIFTSLPGKVKSALGDAGSWLLDTGKDIVHGLVAGIGALKNDVVHALLALIPGPLKKFAGKLGISSPSTVFRGYGENIVQGLINGMNSHRQKVVDAAVKLARTTLTSLQDKLSSLTDAVASIASSVAGAFKPDLFSGGLGDLLGGGAAATGRLRQVLAAINTLKQQGASGAFLQQLFASGNSDLILALASGPASATRAAQTQFNDIQRLTGQIGQQVGAASPEQAELVKVRAEIVLLRKELAQHPAKNGKETAKAMNGTAAHAGRKKSRRH